MTLGYKSVRTGDGDRVAVVAGCVPMGSEHKPEQFASIQRIAERLGKSPSGVHYWVQHRVDEFPAAEGSVVHDGYEVLLWRWPTIVDWLVRTGRASDDEFADLLDPSSDSSEELLTASEVAEMVGWKRSSTAALSVKRGTFPMWAEQHGRTRLWRRGDVAEWMRTARRRQAR